jgi:putative transposase
MLTCMRYIEFNPARAAMVRQPGDYPWSSYRRHAQGEGDAWLKDHACYLALGRNTVCRQQVYRALFNVLLLVHELSSIRRQIQRSGVLGGERFAAQIEATLGRRVRPAKPGRPRKETRSLNTKQETLL